ncbi:BTAD domain-containing putative transcriptional regulator [Couchioplanes caeruleus]|uniref:BTAD domain-containing putative transcriptional regulator n=1 Tax=Couchioplanes caeruleus TaxID=56438 RepID=UPI003CC82BCA
MARALAADGRGADAAAVLRRHARAVVDTLGLDPSAAVRAMQTTLLRGDHRVRPGTGATARSIRRGRFVAAGPGGGRTVISLAVRGSRP